MYWLIALWILPVTAFFLARRYARPKLWRITGATFGAVVAPASLGLYGLYFLGPLVALLGLIGLPLVLFHDSAGYNLAITIGLVQPRTVVAGIEHVYVELLSGAVWATVYGSVGWLYDWSEARNRLRQTRK